MSITLNDAPAGSQYRQLAATTLPEVVRNVCVARVPDHRVVSDDFTIDEQPVPELGPEQVLVQTDYLYVAAAFQDMMSPQCPLPVPPFQIGKPMVGAANVGTVIASTSADLAPGDLVQSMSGWNDYSAGPAASYNQLPQEMFPNPSYFLSQGPTAYYGMAHVANVGPDDVVFVTGAAGGVGSLAGQIAKLRGAKTVIGSAGTAEKVAYLVDVLGFDAAINYREGRVEEELQRFAPEGITVLFDTVGGEQFEIGVRAARSQARLALCGALSLQTQGSDAQGPRLDLMTAITKDLTIRPFATYHTPQQIQEWFAHFGQWLSEGKFVFPHTTVSATLKETPTVLGNLLQGAYTGNVSVQLQH